MASGRTSPISRVKPSLSLFLFWAVIGFGVGVVSGVLASTELNQRQLDRINARDALRADCIAGNERACRVYEVDYAGG